MKKVELNHECWQDWSFDPFFYVGNMKLLGRWNALSTLTVELVSLNILTIMYDNVIAFLKTLYLAATDN